MTYDLKTGKQTELIAPEKRVTSRRFVYMLSGGSRCVFVENHKGSSKTYIILYNYVTHTIEQKVRKSHAIIQMLYNEDQ